MCSDDGKKKKKLKRKSIIKRRVSVHPATDEASQPSKIQPLIAREIIASGVHLSSSLPEPQLKRQSPALFSSDSKKPRIITVAPATYKNTADAEYDIVDVDV